MAGSATATKFEYPRATNMGGKIETGVAPIDTRSVPAPTLINIICTALSPEAKDFTKTVTLRSAPLASMKVICRMEVRTIRETGKDAIIPATEERKPTSMEVLKNKFAMMSVMIQPIAPLESAANLILIIRNTIAAIGSSVKQTDRIISDLLVNKLQ
jgi:hypothetical protein